MQENMAKCKLLLLSKEPPESKPDEGDIELQENMAKDKLLLLCKELQEDTAKCKVLQKKL